MRVGSGRRDRTRVASLEVLYRGRTGVRNGVAKRIGKRCELQSIAAVTTLVALAWFTLSAPDPAAVLAESLRVVLALTVPHMVVVSWLDRSDGPQTSAYVTPPSSPASSLTT